MKLIFAIVSDEDASGVIEVLNSERYTVTKLCSTGGFLRTGNTTMLIGVEDEKLERALDIIKDNSKNRRQYLQSPAHGAFMGGMPAMGVEISVGGATVFISAVERMEKF